MLEAKFRDIRWKGRIRIMNKEYGTEEIELIKHGIINPTGYQELNKTLIEVYMKGKTPNKSDGKVTPINKKNVTRMIVKYFNGNREFYFH